MTIQEVIKKAIEGGFCPNEPDNVVAYFSSVGETEVYADRDTLFSVEQASLASEMFLDPSFWQSLGKALGWRDYSNSDLCRECGTKYSPMRGWQAYWHRLIDHLADGKSAESFFEALS